MILRFRVCFSIVFICYHVINRIILIRLLQAQILRLSEAVFISISLNLFDKILYTMWACVGSCVDYNLNFYNATLMVCIKRTFLFTDHPSGTVLNSYTSNFKSLEKDN